MIKKILFVFLGTILFSSGCISPTVKFQESEKQILIVQKKPWPTVFNRWIFAGGNRLDSKGGETYLLSRILSQSALPGILESQGATLRIEADYDDFSLSYEILSSAQRNAFRSVADFLLNYQISPEEFSLARNQLLQELKVQEDEFYDRVRMKFYEELYGTHRYARPVSGNLRSVQEITLEGVQKVYREMILSSLGGVILVGDETPDSREFYHQILSDFSWASLNQSSQSEVFSGKTGTLVIPADSTQVFVRIGGTGIPRNHPAYLEYLLISDSVGGGFGSMITRRLREEEGLTYSPVANFYSQRQDPGYFFVAYSTRQENLDKSLKLLEEIFNELGEKGISRQNFEMSRRYIYGTFLVREQTYAGQTEILAERLLFGLPEDFWERYKKEIFSLDYEKVNAKIRDYFKHRRFLTVILKKNS